MTRATTLLTTVVLALVLAGMLMVYSASAFNAKTGDLLPKQVVLTAIGCCAMLIGVKVDYHTWARRWFLALAAVGTAALLLLVFVPGIGHSVDGAQRWIKIGGFLFQPSEFAKFTVVLLLAAMLTRYEERNKELYRGFVLPVAVAGFFAFLVVCQRDIGIPAVMMGAACIMLCVAGVRWRYLVLSGLALLGAAYALIVAAPHRVRRMTAFLDPFANRDDAGWQLIQALAAFAQGGVYGQGAGASEQKLGYLPAATTDFIFAVIGEEFGLVGTLTILTLFALLMLSGFSIARHAPDRFGFLLATGIVTLIALQAAFIMAVNVGLLPTKGLPLPFISYGGSALIAYMGMSGILVNIGLQCLRREVRPLAAAA